MFRRRLYSVLIAASLMPFLTGCTLWSQPKNSSWKNATGAEQYERLIWQAIKAKDWMNVESHVASNFVYLDAEGAKDKQHWLQNLRRLTFVDFSLGDVNVIAQGSDAIVISTLSLKGSNAGQALDGAPRRLMSVWQQQKRGWVLVAMTEVGALK